MPRNLLRLISFRGVEISFWDSYSWMSALAISEHARMYRSFSGINLLFFLAVFLLTDAVMVMVAMVQGRHRAAATGFPRDSGEETNETVKVIQIEAGVALMVGCSD